ncbi:MAG TPA: TraY domain-containing protein [Terriglobia bacterium]|nr:TraY domain-containing protein [Terriglobia bacterium]
MLSIRLDPDIERRLAELAQRTGRTKSYYARELIEGNLEDLEDRYLGEARLEKRGRTLTSRQVRKELGLAQSGRSPRACVFSGKGRDNRVCQPNS